MWFDPYCEPDENRTFVSRGKDRQHTIPAGPAPPLNDGDKANFEQLREACKAERLALVSSVRRRDGAHVALVCAMNEDRLTGVLRPVPLATMIEVNPYVVYEDPTLPNPGGPGEDGDQRTGG
jgi:hypothetical protein